MQVRRLAFGVCLASAAAAIIASMSSVERILGSGRRRLRRFDGFGGIVGAHAFAIEKAVKLAQRRQLRAWDEAANPAVDRRAR